MPSAKIAPKFEKKPVILHTRNEVDAYLAEHLTPVKYSPAGRPCYKHEQVKKLNIRFIHLN